MQYLGGKSRIATHLAAVIDEYRAPGQWVWDPFCGGLSMSVALSKKGPVLASDANAALISLYRAVQAGWVPPEDVSLETYEAAKQLPDSDPLKAFCGFGLSFGGIWFSSFTPNYRSRVVRSGPEAGRFKQQWPHRAASRGLVRDCARLVFDCGDFLAQRPEPVDCVLYLDPPYAGTQGYGGGFDHAAFIARVREWATHTDVFVSEYSFELGQCVWERPVKTGQFARGRRVERLYRVRTP